MNNLSPKLLVENYLHLKSLGNLDELNLLLSENIRYEGPLSDDQLKKERFLSLDVKKIFVDGSDVCAIYSRKSSDPKIGDVVFTEWFKIEEGRINSIQSTYNALNFVESHSQI